MKLFFEFFPIFLFFITYKFFGIYLATASAIVASGVQLFFLWLRDKRVDWLQAGTFLVLLLFGGTTLFLHEEIFIKWKPTVINWILAAVFLISQLMHKPLIKTVMQKSIMLPQKIWQTLNLSWVVFWFLMGCLNLYVIYHFDTATWVNFKLFGYLGVTILFIILQAIYINQYSSKEQ
jgi:intracellular septation protein